MNKQVTPRRVCRAREENCSISCMNLFILYKQIIIFPILILFLNLVTSTQLSPSEQSNIRIAVDNAAPEITIISPTNTTYSNEPLLVNFTVLDTTLDSIWYILNNQSKIFINNYFINNYFYLTLQEGDYLLTIYANDSLNNINSSKVSFIIKSSAPCTSCTSNEGSSSEGDAGIHIPKIPDKRDNTPPQEIPKSTQTPNESENTKIPSITEKTPIAIVFNFFPFLFFSIIITLIIFIIVYYYKQKRLKTSKKVKRQDKNGKRRN